MKRRRRKMKKEGEEGEEGEGEEGRREGFTLLLSIVFHSLFWDLSFRTHVVGVGFRVGGSSNLREIERKREREKERRMGREKAV